MAVQPRCEREERRRHRKQCKRLNPSDQWMPIARRRQFSGHKALLRAR
jgi:hypothetical protein